MSQTYGRWGPAHPRVGAFVNRVHLAATNALFSHRGIHRGVSREARDAGRRLRERLAGGETVYLLGLAPAGHNSGAALVEVSSQGGVRLISNDEEERFTGTKHCADFPEQALEMVRTRLADLGLQVSSLAACVATWDYAAFNATGLRLVAEHFPRSLSLMFPAASPKFNHLHTFAVLSAPARVARQLGLTSRLPILALRHHDNHAWFSYAVSPFARDSEPVLITVIDGYGDDAAISIYIGQNGRLTLLRSNNSLIDSLGALYSTLSSTQGGWTTLSSEGRYMGAAAWGDGSRLTNPYYPRLRELVHLAADGEVYINRRMVSWQTHGERQPYADGLRAVVGDPIPHERMWNPDAVLNVDDIEHSTTTRDRVDKAAATQLVFEDALFHIVGHFIRSTGASRLVMTGGTALNCIANMRLLERFDEAYYERHLGRSARLHLWVPPTPGDAGVTMGAAYHFALANGARLGDPLQHAFYCGRSATAAEIRGAIDAQSDIDSLPLGRVTTEDGRARVADFVAFVVARGGVIGLYQGIAETGPRALGHRSILANPCDPQARENINARVKLRERVRPLAPMATLDAALRFFELSPGASDAAYNAYNYMVLTARARPEARVRIPAVVHEDGTSRVQIVREEIDPFTFAYLKAMGRHVGVEVSINTSLNVASPIVQTPLQALDVLRRARALTGLLLIAADGDVWIAWHTAINGPKDGGHQLRAWYDGHATAVSRAAAQPQAT
jgi:carbamoyltransferase